MAVRRMGSFEKPRGKTDGDIRYIGLKKIMFYSIHFAGGQAIGSRCTALSCKRLRGRRLCEMERCEIAYGTGVEFAASGLPVSEIFLSSGHFHPTRDGKESFLVYFGDVWEWTSSSYSPYPGFSPFEGSLGEYNGKFMSSQLVLRGGSCVSSQDHIRKTYRNFFYPRDRWQFSGIRLAKDSL